MPEALERIHIIYRNQGIIVIYRCNTTFVVFFHFLISGTRKRSVFLRSCIQPLFGLAVRAVLDTDGQINIFRKASDTFLCFIKSGTAFEVRRKLFLLFGQLPQEQRNIVILFKNIQPDAGSIVNLIQDCKKRISVFVQPYSSRPPKIISTVLSSVFVE